VEEPVALTDTTTGTQGTLSDQQDRGNQGGMAKCSSNGMDRSKTYLKCTGKKRVFGLKDSRRAEVVEATAVATEGGRRGR